MPLCTRCYKPLPNRKDGWKSSLPEPTEHTYDCKGPECCGCHKPLSSANASPSVLRKGSGRCHSCDSGYQKNRDQQRSQQLRHWVLAHYCGDEWSIRCQCEGCHTREECFLTVDHIDSVEPPDLLAVGKKLRGMDLVYWLVKNEYPEGFQVLCFNCNLAKRDGIRCPMEGEEH